MRRPLIQAQPDAGVVFRPDHCRRLIVMAIATAFGFLILRGAACISRC
jgi:hypothetical protein